MISGHQKGSFGSSVCGSVTLSLFSKLHCDCNDRSSNPQGPTEA